MNVVIEGNTVKCSRELCGRDIGILDEDGATVVLFDFRECQMLHVSTTSQHHPDGTFTNVILNKLVEIEVIEGAAPIDPTENDPDPLAEFLNVSHISSSSNNLMDYLDVSMLVGDDPLDLSCGEAMPDSEVIRTSTPLQAINVKSTIVFGPGSGKTLYEESVDLGPIIKSNEPVFVPIVDLYNLFNNIGLDEFAPSEKIPSK